MNIAAIRAAEEEARRAPTDRQAEILEWIRAFIEKNKFPPTLREIGAQFHIAFQTVTHHLNALQKKGLLRVDLRVSRGIILVTPAVPTVFGIAESVCGVLDRIERRWADIDPGEVRRDLETAQIRIMTILARLDRSGR